MLFFKLFTKQMEEKKVPAAEHDQVYLRHLVSKFTAMGTDIPVAMKADYFLDSVWKALPILRVCRIAVSSLNLYLIRNGTSWLRCCSKRTAHSTAPALCLAC